LKKQPDPFGSIGGKTMSIEYQDAPEGPLAEITPHLAEMARVLFASGSQAETLQQVVKLAVETMEHCQFAGVFILNGTTVTTPAHTDPVVIDIDALQHSTGEGPCLDALAEGGFFYADDLGSDSRWPQFGRLAEAQGIRSAMAVTLSADGTRGALNLYSRASGAFDASDRANGLILAVLADHALSRAKLRDDEELQVENLQKGLLSREVIGQAQGILMERERITASQAFDILRKASERLNVRLKDVAQTLVDTGEGLATEASETRER
jgi:GAF domain-containing protein